MPTTLQLNIVIPDGVDTTDTVAALRLKYATNGTPNPTLAQLRTALEDTVRQELVAITYQYRRDRAPVTPPVLG